MQASIVSMDRMEKPLSPVGHLNKSRSMVSRRQYPSVYRLANNNIYNHSPAHTKYLQDSTQLQTSSSKESLHTQDNIQIQIVKNNQKAREHMVRIGSGGVGYNSSVSTKMSGQKTITSPINRYSHVIADQVAMHNRNNYIGRNSHAR